MQFMLLIQVYMVMKICFMSIDIHIYFHKNLGDKDKVKDCLQISHFLFIKSEIIQEYNHTKTKSFFGGGGRQGG